MQKCRYCGNPIQWGHLFEKRHPFDLETGISHMDTCSKWKKKGFGLRILGDVDTFYRQRWCDMYLGKGFYYPSDLDFKEPSAEDRSKIVKSLLYAGGPLFHANCERSVVSEMLTCAGYDRDLGLVSMQADKFILYRLRDYLNETEFRPYYYIDGVYVHGEKV